MCSMRRLGKCQPAAVLAIKLGNDDHLPSLVQYENISGIGHKSSLLLRPILDLRAHMVSGPAEAMRK